MAHRDVNQKHICQSITDEGIVSFDFTSIDYECKQCILSLGCAIANYPDFKMYKMDDFDVVYKTETEFFLCHYLSHSLANLPAHILQDRLMVQST